MSDRPLIAIADYGMGNRRSVQRALEHSGARTVITADRDLLQAADGVVVPGVGAFPIAMRNLRELGLDELIRRCAAEGTPVLGICLGMQLLFDCSDELEPTNGLGLIAGQVSQLRRTGLRIPHIGWNEVSFERPSRLTDGLPTTGCPFYHVHSLVARPRDRIDVVASTEYGERFATIVARGSVFGVQFHPEKSSGHGLQMLSNFIGLCRGGAGAAPAAAAATRT